MRLFYVISTVYYKMLICTLLTLFISFTLVTWKEDVMESSLEKLLIVTMGSEI